MGWRATKVKIGSNNVTYEGLITKVRRQYLGKDRESMQPQAREFAERAVKLILCPSCHGRRQNEAALSARICGQSIADCSAMQINDLAEFVRSIQDASVGPILDSLRETLDSLVEIGRSDLLRG